MKASIQAAKELNDPFYDKLTRAEVRISQGAVLSLFLLYVPSHSSVKSYSGHSRRSIYTWKVKAITRDAKLCCLEQNKLNKPQKPLNKLAISLLPIRIRRFVSDATVHANSVWRLNLSQLIPSYG